MLIVLVKFRVLASQVPAFRTGLIDNARRSLQEAGCHRFDIGEAWLEAAQCQEFVLYEEYSDRAAFDAHLATAHFRDFDTASQGWVVAKDVQFYQRIT